MLDKLATDKSKKIKRECDRGVSEEERGIREKGGGRIGDGEEGRIGVKMEVNGKEKEIYEGMREENMKVRRKKKEE